MKMIDVKSKGTTLRRVLDAAKDGDVVFLTVAGDTKFVLAPADESDREICALRSNAEFMAHLAEYETRARSAPRKTLQQIRARFKGK